MKAIKKRITMPKLEILKENFNFNVSEYKYQSWCLIVENNKTIKAQNKQSDILEVEEIISKYLKSDDLKMQILGYLSVIFWGFAGSSNFDKKTNEMRAFSRVKKTGLIIKDCDMDDIRLINLNNETAKFVGNIIETIISNVINRKYSSAVAIASLLPQFGFSFATKLIMFIDPINCGVLDKVIAQKFNFEILEWTKIKTKTGSELSYLKSSTNNYLFYAEYCAWLKNMALLMKDENNNILTRAVDVERFIYSIK